ncbi:MAG: hypothetical protein AAFU50_05410, partial [Pseudomonadota bacterium]
MNWGLARKLAITAFGALLMIVALRQGWLPPRYSPLPAIAYDRPTPFVVDWQLKELAVDDALCR